jgi:hypothetical protein
MPQAPAVLLEAPSEPVNAEHRLNGDNSLEEFLGIVVENNRIALKNLNQLKALQNWVIDTSKIYK